MGEAFTKIPNRLIRSTKLTANEKAVFMCIAMCNPSFVSYSRIGEWTGLSRPTVWRCVKKLKEMRVIYQYKTGHGRKVYYDLNFKGFDKEVPTS